MSEKEEDLPGGNKASECKQDSAISSSTCSPPELATSLGDDGGAAGHGAAMGKACLVCGDKALSCNFGAITCESCKAFFRRNAAKEMWGKCDGKCPVAVETRSYCKKCRLTKCFSVGMKKELILNDAQKQERRQKIMENRLRRQGLTAASQSSHSSSASMERSDSPDGIDPRLGYVTRRVIDVFDDGDTPPPPPPPPQLPINTSSTSTTTPLSSSSSSLSSSTPTALPPLRTPCWPAGGNNSSSPPTTAAHVARGRSSSTGPTQDVHHPYRLDGRSRSQDIPPRKHEPPPPPPPPPLNIPDDIADIDLAPPPPPPRDSLHDVHMPYRDSSVELQQVSHEECESFYKSQEYQRHHEHHQQPQLPQQRPPSPHKSQPPQDMPLNCSKAKGDGGGGSEQPIVDTRLFMKQYQVPQPHKAGVSKKIGLEQQQSAAGAGAAEGMEALEPVAVDEESSVDMVKVKEEKVDDGESKKETALGGASSPVSHSLSLVTVDDLKDKMEPDKLELFLEVKKAFSITFDLPVDDPIDPAPSYTDFFNLAELPIKRLVKLAKSLGPFRTLLQDDQIALLKGSVVAVVVIRTAKLFNPSKMGWNITRAGKDLTLSSISLLTSNPEGQRFFNQYHKFVMSLMTVSKGDDGVMMLLILLAVFDPMFDNVKEVAKVLHIRKQYTDVLQQYIEIKYPQEEGMFSQVLLQLNSINEVKNMHSHALQQTPPNRLEPLILEIFDMSKYGK